MLEVAISPASITGNEPMFPMFGLRIRGTRTGARRVFAQAVLAIGAEQALPNWYLGAGGIAQTVWNLQHGVEPAVGIKDYDLVHFDPADLSVEADRQVDEEVAGRLSGRGGAVRGREEPGPSAPVVRTTVRASHRAVHFDRGGHRNLAHDRVERRRPTRQRRLRGMGALWAHGLLGMVVRPNKAMVTRELKLAGPACSMCDYS